MANVTPVFNEVLKRHNAAPVKSTPLSLQSIDEFLKEAYRINAHIASLNAYLKSIRQSYLSTSQPSRRIRPSGSRDQGVTYLTDRQRDEIDGETKQLLREMNASIRNLADAEQIRQNTEVALARKKYGRLGLGALGSWAAGGAGHTKSYEQELEEAKSNAVKMHRESVLWYLRRKLQEAGGLQASMMETRLTREMEKSKSVLSQAQSEAMFDKGFEAPALPAKYRGGDVVQIEDQQRRAEEEQLSPEQVQMFEKQNQDMLKHYEKTLNQVRTAEKSLVEISELQTQLVNNLATQSAHIDQLVADSVFTTENVGGGNKQLKQAAARKSTARMVCYASCAFSLFLITWDLLI